MKRVIQWCKSCNEVISHQFDKNEEDDDSEIENRSDFECKHCDNLRPRKNRLKEVCKICFRVLKCTKSDSSGISYVGLCAKCDRKEPEVRCYFDCNDPCELKRDAEVVE